MIFEMLILLKKSKMLREKKLALTIFFIVGGSNGGWISVLLVEFKKKLRILFSFESER